MNCTEVDRSGEIDVQVWKKIPETQGVLADVSVFRFRRQLEIPAFEWPILFWVVEGEVVAGPQHC